MQKNNDDDNNNDKKSLKYDTGKLRWDLLPVEALEQVIRVFMYGAQKYSDHNWTYGMKWSKHFNAALRHLSSFWKGEDIDPESGLHHMAHAAACALIVLQYTFYNKKFDDRHSYPRDEALNGAKVIETEK